MAVRRRMGLMEQGMAAAFRAHGSETRRLMGCTAVHEQGYQLEGLFYFFNPCPVSR
jgi:hypothetical protein